MDGEDGWDKYYRCVIQETSRLVDEMLDRFRVSLGDFLYAMLNWPTDDWREQLNRFVEHTRYYGLIIEPESIRAIHDLIEARVNGTGPFAALGPYGGPQSAGTGPTVQLAMAVSVGVAATKARAQEDNREAFFNRKLALAQEHLDEMGRVLESLGQKLDAAKADETVEVETEVDTIENLIWQYNDALESAREAWLDDDLGGDTYDRLVLLSTPRAFNLPLFTDERQAQRAKQQEIRIGQRLGQRTATLDRIIFGMKVMEAAGTAASVALGAGVVITAVKTGGKWAIVKTIAKTAAAAGAAMAAGEAAEHGLRAAGASEETIHGVRLAAEVVTWLLLLRRIRAAGAKPAPPAAPKPAAPKATQPRGSAPARPAGRARLPRIGTRERAAIETARRKAIEAAKANELASIRAGGKGSGVWTESELEQIRKSGKFPVDAQWHHDPTVANRPDLAGDPSIVRPVRGGTQGHLDAHGGDFRKPYAQEGE